MANTVRTTYYGMEGEGPNLKEARADAARKLEAAVTGYYTPAIMTYRGYVIMAWREVESGWWYTILTPDRMDTPVVAQQRGANSGGQSAEDTIRAARRHLAQYIYDPRQPDATYGEALNAIDSHDLDGRREFTRWAMWQSAYRTAANNGADDTAARIAADQAVMTRS